MVTAANGDGRIRRALERAAGSAEFAASKRLQRFLAHIVEEALAGRADGIKEYSLGVAVFDRDEGFDPRTDTIVRVEARRLRHLLEAYYRGSGAGEEIRIEIPKGGYVPVFRGGETEGRRSGGWGRRVAAGGVAVVAVVVLGAWMWMGQGRVPEAWLDEGQSLKVLDAEGRVCWQRVLPERHVTHQNQIVEKALIVDADGDGKRETFYQLAPRNLAEAGGSLLCFEQDGRLRWEHRYGPEKELGGRRFEARYVGRFVRLVTVGGRTRVLAVANHYLWHPAQVNLLDVKSGERVAQYWHPGAIQWIALRDFDGDGAEELVFAAINNPGDGPGHAAVGVLKLPWGRSAARGALAGGGEWKYALLPYPDVSRAAAQLPLPAQMSVGRDGRILVQTPLPERGGIVYVLDGELRAVETRFSDNYAALHERMRSQGLLDHRLSEEELAGLKETRRFESAPDGNSAEVASRWRRFRTP